MDTICPIDPVNYSVFTASFTGSIWTFLRLLMPQSRIYSNYSINKTKLKSIHSIAHAVTRIEVVAVVAVKFKRKQNDRIPNEQ